MDLLGICSCLLAIVIAYRQWKTHERQLRLDLYRRRYKFYDRLLGMYCSLPNKPFADKSCTMDDIAPFLSEASWLFGEDMRAVVNDMDGKTPEDYQLSFHCLPEDVEKVFRKYMTIEKVGKVGWIFSAIIEVSVWLLTTGFIYKT